MEARREGLALTNEALTGLLVNLPQEGEEARRDALLLCMLVAVQWVIW
jgi:hypothetical protein